MVIKLFSVLENKNIEGEYAELYCNFYIVFSRTYFFTFFIKSPNLSCADRNPIRLIKNWVVLVEEDNVKYMRRYEREKKAREYDEGRT